MPIHIASLPTRNINIVAYTNTGRNTGSVKFILNKKHFRTENVYPFALAGDNNSDFSPWTPQKGNYTLTAIPYTSKDAKGECGTPKTIKFTVIDDPVFGYFDGATLINADTHQPVKLYDPFYSGQVISTKFFTTTNFNIRANAYGAIRSVQFLIDGKLVRTENKPPFALYGDENGKYYPGNLDFDTPLLTMIGYSEPNAQGKILAVYDLLFRVRYLV